MRCSLPPPQERLRTLRASLGSFKAPPAEESPRPHQRLAAPTAAPSRSARLAHTPPRRRPDKHASDTPSRTGALAVLAPPRWAASGTLESAGSAPWAAENSTEVGQGSEVRGGQATGRLLECQAVQGLCQLLEHHVAVLEQSQEPVGKLLQSDATQNGMLVPDCCICSWVCQSLHEGSQQMPWVVSCITVSTDDSSERL